MDRQLKVVICLTKLTVKFTDSMLDLEKVPAKIYLPMPNSNQNVNC